MPSHNPPVRETGRERRLDDLFGDDPYLSPTMRARRIVEAEPTVLADAPARSPAMERIADTPDDDDAQFWFQRTAAGAGARAPRREEDDSHEMAPTPRLLRIVEALAAESAVASEPAAPPRKTAAAVAERARRRTAVQPAPTPIRLPEAAALLRSEAPGQSGNSHGPILERLRSDVLLRWLKQVPPRRPGAETEER